MLSDHDVSRTSAELIEAALREHMRLKITPTTIEHAQCGWPIRLSGGEAEDAARIALGALAKAGLVVVPTEALHTYTAHRRTCRADGAGEPCTCGLAALTDKETPNV